MVSKQINDIAAFRACSWFESIGIPCNLTENGISIKDKKGKIALIRVRDRSRAKLALNPSLINNRNVNLALDEFKRIVKGLGYKYKPPFNRGSIDKRLNFNDNFELIAMRHCDFRRSPNPPPEYFKKFAKTVDLSSYKFIYFNYRLCKRNLIEFSDLQTYANIWLTNYYGNFKDPRLPEKDNYRLLYTYLMQRFYEFKAYLMRKEENCLPEYDTFCISSFGNYSREYAVSTDMQPESYEERRSLAIEQLRERLGELSVEEKRNKLLAVYNNKETPKDVKEVIDEFLGEKGGN